jgi:signal transduction histidine kinase
VRVTAGLIETAAEVSDDGIGAAAAPAPGDGLPEWAGNGLTGLAERVSVLGGHLEVASRPEGGFRVRASVPTPAALSRAPA